MSSAEARKLDILLDLKKNGYNLIDGDQPELMTMALGGGHTLVCNVKKPTKDWKIIFNDGVEITEYPADSEKVVHTYRGDADKLIKEYNEQLMALFEDGVRANEVPDAPKEAPVKTPKKTQPEGVKNDSFQPGGYNKVKSQEPYEYAAEDWEECSPTLEEERILNRNTQRTSKVVDAEYQVHSQPVRKPWRTIKGLTPRLAECGKIKIGIKGETRQGKNGEYRLPTKIDHFIVTTMDKVNDDFAPDKYIMDKLGTTCREIPVRLPYDDPSLNFPTSYAYYDSAACKCRGDGELAVTSTGEVIDCNPETCPNVKDKKCKPNGVLSLILDDAPRVGGVYKFRTTGWNSINNLFSSMEFIRGLTNGLLAGLPLMLTLTPKHTVIPGTKTSTTIYMVNLEYRGSLQDMVTAIQQTMNTRALMQYSVKDFEKLAEETLAIPEAPEECKAIVEEFYPEAVA